MKNLATSTGREIKVTSNVRLRHYTIRTSSGTYRTFPMSKQEFNDCRHNTGNDWNNYLQYESYLKVR